MIWWVAAALAAPPRFVAKDPALEARALDAWQAAQRCTGWEAPAHDRVPIHKGFVPGAYGGRAFVDEEGLYRIEVGLQGTERILVHEVAHAWTPWGPTTLVEGRTDLLADCMAERMSLRTPPDPDVGAELSHLVDLRTWEDDEEQLEATSLDPDSVRRDAYLGAARLMRVVAALLPDQTIAEALWPSSRRLTWAGLSRALERSGPAGDVVLATLEGGVEHQRRALSDGDRDGLPQLGELLTGSDPNRWDSDGDGWWDGAEIPGAPGAIPIPRDGTPVCTGLAAGAGDATVQVLTDGPLRTLYAGPLVRLASTEGPLEGNAAVGVQVPARERVLLSLDRRVIGATGGLWARVGGMGMALDETCRSSPRSTVWSVSGVGQRVLAPFTAAVEEHLDRVEGLAGPLAVRLVVELGTDSASLSPTGVVSLSTAEVAWARRTGRVDALAALAVSVHRVMVADEGRTWNHVEALTRSLVDDPPPELFRSADEFGTRRLLSRADDCEDGWSGMFDGRCAE